MRTNLLFICRVHLVQVRLNTRSIKHKATHTLSDKLSCPSTTDTEVLLSPTANYSLLLRAGFFMPSLSTLGCKSRLGGTGCAQWLAAVLVLPLPQLMPAAYPVVKTGESPRTARHPGPALLPYEEAVTQNKHWSLVSVRVRKETFKKQKGQS